MTPERAEEIINEAIAYPSSGPWVDNLDRVMKDSEREEVLRYWDTLEGYTSFFDALSRIRFGYAVEFFEGENQCQTSD